MILSGRVFSSELIDAGIASSQYLAKFPNVDID
jgi:hypothetical protein